MKKELLILMPAMHIGGAEKSLIGMLESFDYEKINVSVFFCEKKGELLPEIPDKVMILDEKKEYSSINAPIIELIKRGHIKILLGRCLSKLLTYFKTKNIADKTNIIMDLEYSHKYTKWALPMIDKKTYDLVISFMTPHYFAVEKVHAKKRMAWIHTDYTKMKIDSKSELKMWSKFDVIASISEETSKGFIKVFPDLKEKVQVIENIVPMRYLEKRKNEFSVQKDMPCDGRIKLLSIGRFCTAKNFENIPSICRKIINKGYKVVWYIIGFGGMESEIKEAIKREGVEQHVVILGKKENPYPYIKECDVYVQPSLFEGKCVSVIEAQILGKPVIITDYPSANSQLKDGYDGIIVPLDNEKCANGIIKFLANKNLQNEIINNVKQSRYDNVSEINKIYKILDSNSDRSIK